MDMTLNQLTKKLIKNNIRQYGILIGSIIFAISMITSYGIIQFSPTVTNILMSGGSTQMISLSLYGFNIIGSFFFVVYAHSLFLKYKSREIGVFISLGIKRSSVKNMVMKELRIIIPLATLSGLIFSIPVSFGAWYFMTIFLNTSETKLIIGWIGIVIGAVFGLASMIIINIITLRYIKNVDIIKILKSNEEVEDIKGDNYILGMIGIILIPLGVFSFSFFSMSKGFLGDIYIIFLGVSLIGLYLFIIQITSIGVLVKKINKKYYYKNIVFFNLVKQKGKQYVLTLFVSTILIGISIFALGFNSIQAIEGINEIEKIDAFDVVVNVGFQQKNLNLDDVLALAKKHNINVKDLNQFENIMLGYSLPEYNQWGADSFISEESVKKITEKKDFDVKPGTFVTLISVDPSYLNKNKEKRPSKEIKRLLLDSTKRKETYFVDKGEVYVAGLLSFDIFHERRVKVLDSTDYNALRANQKDEFIVKTYMFNVDNWKETKEFSKDLAELVAKKSDYKWCSNFSDSPIFDRVLKNGYGGFDHYDIREYKGNELFANKRWALSPYTRYHAYYNGIQDYGVYLLLMMFIAIVAFISSVVAIGIKILNTMWQDKYVYRNITFFGSRIKDIKSVITKQVALIYFVPTALGSILTMLILREMINTSEIYFRKEVFMINCSIVAIMFVFQIIIFLFIRKIAIKECTDFKNI